MSAFPLPSGWAIAPISDVIREVRTIDPSTEPSVEITYFDISSIDNEAGRVSDAKVVLGADAPSRARQIVQARDILFSTVRPNLRAIALVPEVANGIASTGFCVLRAALSMDPNYLYFYARSEVFLDALLPLARGVSYPAVRSGDVVSQSIPVAPAAEQTRIVEKLEELLSDLDAGVAELKSAQKKLGQYRQSLLKAAVEGTLTAEWRKSQKTKAGESGAKLLQRILRERRARWEAGQLAKFEVQGKVQPKDWQAKYLEPVALDTAGLPALPLDWVWASVEQVADVISGFAFKSSDFVQNGVAVTKIANVGYGVYVSESTQEFLPTEFIFDYSDFKVCSDDILIALTRPITSNTLKSCRYPKNSLPSLLNQRVAMIKIVLEETAEYIYTVTRTPYFREAVRSSTSETLQPNMSPNSLKLIRLPLPPNVEAAVILEMVNAHLNEVNLQEVAIIQSLKQSAAQRKNILQAAFSGQLVPQDPVDEPASELLKRIRAERAARMSHKTKRRNAKKTK